MTTTIEFQDVEIVKSPVIFKEINVTDFDSNIYHARIGKITPTEQGYISEQVKNEIDFIEKNTVVINAGVGQGKTHTILDIARWYYDNDYVVIFAVPYKSLIDQYFEDLTGDERRITAHDIVDYRKIIEDVNGEGAEEIENPIIPSDASLRPIHLLTVNCFLSNPGEDFIIQAEAKLNYLKLLINRCQRDTKKVVLIFDEIHDSFHLFKDRFIFHLYNWGDLIQKIYCISATYNEASKTVIKYLSLITDKKIQIIESERIKFEFKQSDLFLLLYNKYHYDASDEDLITVFRYLISQGKRINVLSYSKSLATSIADEEGEIGKLLVEKYGEVNLCIGGSDTIFDPAKCNIGTTFTTGINIRGNDSAFLVILPSKLSYDQNRLGVFSRGINTLIQSLARIRDKSEIYIITPSPDFLLNYRNPNGEDYTGKVESIDFFKGIQTKDRYFNLNNQRELIEEVYHRLRSHANEGVTHASNLTEGVSNNLNLRFPSLDDYILLEGEKVLFKTYEIFGKNFSVYTFWAAFNDQFINCRLKGLVVLNQLLLKEGEVMKGLRKFAFEKLYEYTPIHQNYVSEYFQLKSDKECFQVLKSAIFGNTVHLMNENSKVEITERRNPVFVRRILALVQLLKKDNEYYKRQFYSNYERHISIGELIDAEYEAKDYLFACFINSERTDFAASTTDVERALINSYKTLLQFYNCFKERYVRQDINGRSYFENEYPDDIVSVREIRQLKQAILLIQEYDKIIELKTVSFFQGINSQTSDSDLLKSIIRFYKNTFFETKIRRVITNSSGDNRRDVIINEFMPPKEQLLNLLFVPELEWLEDNHGLDGIVIDTTYSPNHPDLDI